MSRRDPLRPYMNIIDKLLQQLVIMHVVLWSLFCAYNFFYEPDAYALIPVLYIQLNEDPTFKPQGGNLGENDMDYDTNDKSMAQLRRHLRRARERYYRYRRYVLSEVIN